MTDDRCPSTPASLTTATGELIEGMLASISGPVIDRATVIDGLLDVRLSCAGRESLTIAVDEALRAVPGRTLVACEWYTGTLRNLADLPA